MDIDPPNNDINWRDFLYLAINGACFVIFTSLAALLLNKTKGVLMEGRALKIITVFIATFLLKTIIWTLTILKISVKILQVIDNIIACVILSFLFIFIFDMISVKTYLMLENPEDNIKS